MKFLPALLFFGTLLISACSSDKSSNHQTNAVAVESSDPKDLFSKSEEVIRLKQQEVDYDNLVKASFSELFRRDKCKGECGKRNVCIGKSYTVTTVIGDGTFLKSPERLFVSMENDRSEILQIETDSTIFMAVVSFIEANRNSTFSLTGFMTSYEGNMFDRCSTGPLLIIKDPKDIKVIE